MQSKRLLQLLLKIIIKKYCYGKQTIHFNPPLGGHLLEDINSNTNNAENEETSRKTATHLNAHANTKITI